MTTVVTSVASGTMAADTQATGHYNYRVQKIYRLPDGSLIGGAGDTQRCYAAIQWLLNGQPGDPPKIKGVSLMMLRPDGTIWLADDEFPMYPLLDKSAAIGSGSQAAAALLARGVAPADVVKEIAKIEAYTSDPVQVLHLETPAKPARKRATK